MPDYMTSLPQNVIDDIVYSSDADRIISCGIDPEDARLCIVTERFDVRYIAPNGSLIPRDAVPSHDGSRIAIIFHSLTGIFAIDSKLAIRQSTSALQRATLCVSGSSLGEFFMTGETYLKDDEYHEALIKNSG